MGRPERVAVQAHVCLPECQGTKGGKRRDVDTSQHSPHLVAKLLRVLPYPVVPLLDLAVPRIDAGGLRLAVEAVLHETLQPSHEADSYGDDGKRWHRLESRQGRHVDPAPVC